MKYTITDRDISGWKRAMESGSLTGRLFARQTIWNYTTYINLLIESEGRGISASSLRRFIYSQDPAKPERKRVIYRSIRSILGWKADKHPEYNILLEEMVKWRPKGNPTPKRGHLTPGQVELIVNQENLDLQDRFIFLLILHTGLRASEVCNLKLADVDIEQRRIQVREGKWGKSSSIHTYISSHISSPNI